MFDNQFTTVPYLASLATVPPNWPALNEHSTERATNEQEALVDEWPHPLIEADEPDISPDTIVPV